MIVAVHALVGAALGRFCRHRRQALAVGFVSHLPCDLAPHRDLEVPQEAVLLGATMALIAAARGLGSKEFSGAFGAAVPDIENLIGRVLGIPDEKLLIPTHSRYHGRRIDGLGSQAALAVACLAIAFWPTSRDWRCFASLLPKPSRWRVGSGAVHSATGRRTGVAAGCGIYSR